MEKEVRAICERYRKGEELIFISKVNSHLLKMGEEFLIYRIEVDDNNVFRNKFYLKSKCDKKSFSVESQELINLFELKQPKDPNELKPEKKTKKERIEELEKRVKQLEKAVKIGMDELTKITTLRINGKIKESEKQAPEFWYVDIVEEKDSELLPTFKEWFVEKAEFEWSFDSNNYGYSNSLWRKGYQASDEFEDFVNSDKMQKITLNEWNEWFNK
jgi:hypothetical protein